MGRKRSLVFGVGINDWAGSIWVNGKPIKEYYLWQGMLERCFSDKLKQKYPTYQGVTCSKDWLLMTKFVEDISKMKGYILHCLRIKLTLTIKIYQPARSTP